MSLEGQQLGRYRLLRLIGSGGMGEVYLAEDPGINRQVAIKVIRSEIAPYPGGTDVSKAAALFQREARAVAMLDHPHILPLFDYGEQKRDETTLTYLVMPYRSEGSLASWLQRRGTANPLPLPDIEHIIHQAAGALQYAHDHQLIHQDVKPSNFLIRVNTDNPNRPDLLLTDFGIARLSTLTSGASQSIRGTPGYMAPEQWEGHPVPASDQYALALMAYELLTDRSPFQGNPMQMMYAHINTQPPAPSSINPRLPAAIDSVILRALAKKPEERFPSISAFASTFQQALQSSSSVTFGRASNPDLPTFVRASNPDLSTFVKTPNTPSGADLLRPRLSTTLAISEAEARNGTNRALTLPGGRRVTVSIPPGAQNGQVIDLSDPGDPSIGSSPGILRLTLSVVSQAGWKEDEATRIANAGSIAATNDIRNAPYQQPGHPQGMLLPPQQTIPEQPTPLRGAINRAPTRNRTILWVSVIVVLLLVLGSGGLFYYLGGFNFNGGNSNASATATAQAQAGINATNTAQASAVAGAANDATATAIAQKNASVNATATAVAQDKANAQATANANATATTIAQANANATATAAASTANPYPPHSGTLVLNDPLVNNSNGYNWQEYNDSSTGNACQFASDGYHVVRASNYGGPCFAQATDFSNFTYQVQMTFVRAGTSFSGGGIIIRGSGSNYYYFEIFESGKYVLAACQGNDCSHAVAEDLSHPISSFHSGLNQNNTVAIVANSYSFDLYVNGSHVVGPVTDTTSTSSHGTIGVFGEGGDATSEVVYSNAKVWA
jgi:serine/threonine protein kinase